MIETAVQGTTTKNQVDYLFELGKTRSLSGNFLGAIRILEEASDTYIQNKNFEKYMECINILLRIHKEMQNVQKISLLKEELLEVVWENSIKLSSSIRCTLGLCALYLGNISEAQEEFEKALTQTKDIESEFFKQNNEAEALRARIEAFAPLEGLFSISVFFNKDNKNEEQLNQEIEHLEKLLLSFKNLERDIEIGRKVDEGLCLKRVLQDTASLREKFELNTQLLKVAILRMQSRYYEAGDILWKCYDRVQKSRDLWSIVTFFYYLGQNYLDKENYDQAKVFLNLAQKSIDDDNFKHLNSLIQVSLNRLNTIISTEYDLIVNLNSHSIIEKNKGKVDFKNQFILFNLMKIFLENPRKVYSKEYLIESVWKQKYNPEVHDNKIYVTIKRLRQVLEPDSRSVRYICCAREGYYLSNKVKVLIQDRELEQSQEAQL